MTNDNVFLRAILAAPGDSCLRLVYADWLDDHDDARGEFIRVEVEIRSLQGSERSRAEGDSRLGAPTTEGGVSARSALGTMACARLSRRPEHSNRSPSTACGRAALAMAGER